ncbi:FAD-dependent monooxygenase [Streptomyces sp. NPDC019937]|uniref:NAD(P)/FAD-dependent oxidoreductase n=1 Tax=Streptomyces sp. NPDC019937 TaxID=3154787 RepID=UPI0033EA61CF
MSGAAVVIGGGLAGMLAASALLDHVDAVTVIERDRYPDGPEFRKGVPQARHPHILLGGGIRAMTELLPGAEAALLEAGAHRLDVPRDLLARFPDGWWRRHDERRQAFLSCTRPMLDHVVRGLLSQAAERSSTRVDILQATEAIGLLGTPRRVSGVRVAERDGDRAERELHADLVVDASGRGSRAPEWLAELGHPTPDEDILDAGLAYATRVVRLDEPGDRTGIQIHPAPGIPRSGVVLPVEGGNWMVALAGFQGHQPPTDEAGFLEFAATLPDPIVHRLLKTAQPCSPIRGFRNTANRRRKYHLPGGVPEGFVVLADAACTFNPIYGHGMSVAAFGALALRGALAQHGVRPGLAAAVQPAIAGAADVAWNMAVAADRPYASGDSTSSSVLERLRNRYLARLYARAGHDPVVCGALCEVITLEAAPSLLVSPSILLRTLLPPRRPGLSTPPQQVTASGGRRAFAGKTS